MSNLNNWIRLSQSGNRDVHGGLSRRVDDLNEGLARLNVFMGAVVLVLLVGFAAMFVAVGIAFVDAFNGKQASAEALRVQVQEQNHKIEALTTALNNQAKTQSPTQKPSTTPSTAPTPRKP